MRFRNYRNKHTNDNKIYSVENIQNMTVKDAFSRKQELLAQNRSIGVPTEDELKNSSNAVWVNSYVKDDGTEVSGHWRSLPDRIKLEADNENETPNTGSWDMPCNGQISSYFGTRESPVAGASTNHNGWDIQVPVGTPVKAIYDGVVLAVGPAKGYGYWVVINHGTINGKIVTSEYGHLSSSTVSVGQKIKHGEVVAKSGNAGISSGPHLHITIREGAFQGKAVDPAKYIKH